MSEDKGSTVNQQVDVPSLPTKRLVLGFDAGCTMCSDLAQRIEEKVGDKLEVRSLHDPHVEHWRTQAIGANAPWAPILIEVEGEKVTAWTGLKMGPALSKRLGLLATWRVMRAFGGRTTLRSSSVLEDAEGATSMSRGRFLQCVGGAAVALFALSGFTSLTSVAAAAAGTSSVIEGTQAQRARATRIVRSSKEFEALVRKTGQSFDFGRARFGFREDDAVVAVPTKFAGGFGFVATFILDFQKGVVVYHKLVKTDRDSAGRRRLTVYDDRGTLTPITIGADHIIAPDGRKISHSQVKREVESNRQASESVRWARDRCSDCLNRQYNICKIAVSFGCALLPAWAVFACYWHIAYTDSRNAGCRASARTRCYFRISPPPCP